MHDAKRIARREMTVSSLAKNMKMTAKQKEIPLNNVKTTVYRISFSTFVRIYNPKRSVYP